MGKIKSLKWLIVLAAIMFVISVSVILGLSYIKEKNHNYKGVFVTNGRLFKNC